MDAFSLGEELLILDGDNFKQRPWEELELVQDFLGIPRVVTSQVWGGWQQTKTCPQIKDMSNATKDNQLVPAQDYYLNKTKGFYCLRHLGCLKDGKGHKDFSSLFGQDLQDKLAVRSIFCH